MINLINLLVAQGTLTRAQGEALIKEANEEAAEARAARGASPPSPAAAAAGAGASATAPSPPGTVRVMYVPEVVKKQMREEIKKDVLAQAKEEKWAAPNAVPEWVSRLRFYGDFRGRFEGDFFPEGNDNTGAFPNFNAINTGSPFDVTGNSFPPQLNVDQDRRRFRLRARLGVDANLGEGFTSGLRLATGETNSPISENQTVGGAANAQGGNFSKYAVWLDRAYLRYEPWNDPQKSIALEIGRFDNPFFSTSLIFEDEIAFDGAALLGRFAADKNVSPFVTIGAFPVFNTDFNFATNQPAKFPSHDRWLYAAQVGTTWKINRDFTLKAAGAYYYFDSIEGKLSSPCIVVTAQDSCDTDDRRPSFAQKGNTYMMLRDIVPTALNNNGTINQFQFFGLATPFHEVAVTARLDYDHFDPKRITLDGEFVKNVAFHRGAIDQVAVNNRGSSVSISTLGPFVGGDIGYVVRLTAGDKELTKLWDWNVSVGYKYIESDAVVDAFNDADFGLGGTNLKGYIVGGSLGFSPNVWARLRWMSADSIAGPPFAVDVLQFDLNGRF